MYEMAGDFKIKCVNYGGCARDMVDSLDVEDGRA